MATESLTFTRLPSDANGNPRYAVSFLNLLKADESYDSGLTVAQRYAIACKRANAIGGRRYSCKRYGGGIAFCSYSIQETANAIGQVTGRTFVAKGA